MYVEPLSQKFLINCQISVLDELPGNLNQRGILSKLIISQTLNFVKDFLVMRH